MAEHAVASEQKVQSVINRKTGVIGIILPDSDHQGNMDILEQLSTELKQNGYYTVLIPREVNGSHQDSLGDISGCQVDGIISFSTEFNICENSNIPVVKLCSEADNYDMGRKAAELFSQRGAEHMAYLTGHIPGYTNTERQQGFVDGVVEATGKSPQVVNAHYNYEESLEHIRKLLSEGELPEAVFCSTDILAIALIDVARHEFSLRIPEDIQVIGFDDIPQASWKSYELTTFRQDFRRLAKESVRMLLQHIQNNEQSLMKLMLPTQLVKRKTIKPA